MYMLSRKDSMQTSDTGNVAHTDARPSWKRILPAWLIICLTIRLINRYYEGRICSALLSTSAGHTWLTLTHFGGIALLLLLVLLVAGVQTRKIGTVAAIISFALLLGIFIPGGWCD